jgi:hypothetical protein
VSLRDRFLLALALVVMGVGFRWATKAWKEEIRGEREREAAPAEPPPSSQVRVEDIPKEDASVLLRSPAPPTASPRAPKAGARIHGRVTVAGSEAPLPEGSRIEVRGSPLRGEPLDPTGRYEVRFDAEALPGERTLLVAIPGRAFVRKTIRIAPGDDVRVDLVSGAVGREGALRGRVLDEAGQPVPGLRLLIQRSEAERDLEARLASPATDADEGYANVGEGVAITGTDGRFGLVGLPESEYAVVSLDDAWIAWNASLRPTVRVDSGEEALVAARAFVLEGYVIDAETVEVLQSIRRTQRIRVNGEFRGSDGAIGNVNPFRWQAPIPEGGELGFDVVFDVEAEGYRSARRTVRFEPGHWVETLEVALERPRYERGDLGRLRILHEIRDETGRPAALAATLWEVDADGGKNRRAAHVTSGDDGFGMVELPTGPAEVEFVVLWWGGYPGPLRWRGNVDVVGAATTDFRVQFPPAGALRVHPAEAATGMRRLVLVGPGSDPRGPMSSVRVRGSARTVFLPGVPIGRWRIQVDGAGEESAVTVEVEEGRVTEAVLPK